VPGDGQHRFLHDILSFDFGQAGLAGDAINQLPLGIEKVLPA